jgi:hypothetical protein
MGKILINQNRILNENNAFHNEAEYKNIQPAGSDFSHC